MPALIGLFGSVCNQNIQRDLVKLNQLGASWEATSILVRQPESFIQPMIVLVWHHMEHHDGSNLPEKPF